jgi:hypothetical protein
VTAVGIGVWFNGKAASQRWTYGGSSAFGELKAWGTTREAARAAYRLLSGVIERELRA